MAWNYKVKRLIIKPFALYLQEQNKVSKQMGRIIKVMIRETIFK